MTEEIKHACLVFEAPEVRLSDGVSFEDSIAARGILKENAIAYSRAGVLAGRASLRSMPRIKPELHKRERWLAMREGRGS